MTATSVTPRVRPALIANILGQLAFGLAIMTICLPSMQEWGRIFDTDQSGVQLTFSGYVAAYGVLQLVYGPLSDRYGRRPVLLLGVSEPEWGQRLTALVRPVAGACGAAEQGAALIHALELAVMAWPVAERPRRWLLCETLAPSPTGKWQRSHWQRWLASLEADQTPLA